MNYKSIDLKDCITVDKIFTIHYFEYMSDFSFPGESHDFWEFICVDKGDVKIRMGDSDIILKKGQVAFHKPNEFHTGNVLFQREDFKNRRIRKNYFS